jgi:hypothetical protein
MYQHLEKKISSVRVARQQFYFWTLIRLLVSKHGFILILTYWYILIILILFYMNTNSILCQTFNHLVNPAGPLPGTSIWGISRHWACRPPFDLRMRTSRRFWKLPIAHGR